MTLKSPWLKQSCIVVLMDDEDALIQAYIDAALEVCQKHIGKRFDNGLEFTPAIKIGCLMYVSQLYEYRTMIAM
jgi:uncharacterized phage protein (predicted DNA packaging)